MKRIISINNSITLLILGLLLNAQPTVAQADLSQTFNTALIEKATELESYFDDQFNDAALLIKNYQFNFETQPIDEIYQNFNDFINDTATNYFVAMYNTVNNQITGLPSVKNSACPPADPLSMALGIMPTCGLTQKDEYALEEADDTLVAIAYEYSRQLKILGTEIINQTGLLDKLIAMAVQQLTYANLPTMIVQDSTWIDQFKTQEGTLGEQIWSGIKQSAQATGAQLVAGLKDDLYELAGKELDTWLENAKSSTGPLMQEITDYRDRLANAEKSILQPLDEIKATIDEKLTDIKQVSTDATQSFVSYIDSAMENFSSELFVAPLEAAIKSVTDEIAKIDVASPIQSVSDTVKQTTQSLITQATTVLSDATNTIQSQIDQISQKIADPLTQLNTSLADKLTALSATDLTSQLPESIQTEVDSQLQDITNSLTSLATDVTQDVTSLMTDFISPITNSLTQLDTNTKSLETLDIFGQTPTDIALAIQTAISDTNTLITDALAVVTGGVDDVSNQLKDAFNSESVEIQTIITQSVDLLTNTATQLKDDIINYLTGKITIISDLVAIMDEAITKIQDVSGRDFLDLAESFIVSPTKALKNLENLVTCKTTDDSGICSETYVQYLDKQLSVTKIPNELAEFYTSIVESLTTTFDEFSSQLQDFIQAQQEKSTTLFDSITSSALGSGQSTKEILTTLPTITATLIDTVKEKALGQVQDILSQAETIKSDLLAISDNFAQTPKLDDVMNLVMKNKNTAQAIIASLPAKVDALTSLVQAEASDKAQELITQLNEVKDLATTYSQTLATSLSSTDILGTLQNTVSNIDALSTEVTSGALETVNAITKQLTNLADTSKTLSDFIANAKDILNNQLFEKIQTILTNLNLSELDVLNRAKNLSDYTTSIQETFNSILSGIEGVSIPTVTLAKDGENYTATFESEEIASQVQMLAQDKLDATILPFITLTQDGPTIIIETNFISVASQKFYELIDDAIVLITDKLTKVFQTLS